nr:nucleoside diphosphate-linked moiety X motif 8 [Pelodiscus sinensis]|eukprot:XP_006110995.2 nucleoside diphosphate-linked moiety X motif 8 [Pelodiscus sinensis]
MSTGHDVPCPAPSPPRRAPHPRSHEGRRLGTGVPVPGERAAVPRAAGGLLAAAVLVTLCSVGGYPALLYTLRSSTLTGHHKGDVSFPGGKRDSSDQDVIATALRETQEELGLRLEAESVWGVMRPIPSGRGLTVAPVLANLGPLEYVCLNPNQQEVEDVFTIPLSHLLQAQNQGYTHFRHQGRYSHTLPVFLNGRYRVWGLTAIITDLTLELLAPSAYRRRMRPPSTR